MTGRDTPILMRTPAAHGCQAVEAGLHWDAVLLALQQAITFADLLVEPVSQVCLPKALDTLSPVS